MNQSSTVEAPQLAANDPSQNNDRQWIVIPDSLKEEFCTFSTYSELNDYRAELSSRFGNTYLDGPNARAKSKNVHDVVKEGECHSWVLYIESEALNKILFYREIVPSIFDSATHKIHDEYGKVRKKYLGFHQWLKTFAPKDWNDLLMVRECYRDHVITGQVVDWQQFANDDNEHLNAHLRQSRGFLYWPRQLHSLVHEAMSEFLQDDEAVTEEECSRVIRGYLARPGHQSKARRFAESLHVCGQPLVEIIDRRRLIWSRNTLSGDRWHTNPQILSMAELLWGWRAW